MKTLGEITSGSLIVCYKEDVSDLEAQLKQNALHPTILRGSYTPEELRRPAAMRTFMGHRRAWQIAAEAPGYTLICEADFVPCRNLGALPVFWPLESERAWGYLYQGSPRVLSLIGSENYLRGHCAPLVAYIINRWVAERMLRFYDHSIATHGMEKYYTFDAHLQWWMMGEGAEAFIPTHHYGEHGGIPNPEHSRLGFLRRSGWHRADNLAGSLAFLPQYARGSRLRFWKERIEGRAYGWARLLSGRWIVDTNVYSRNRQKTVAMQMVGIKRLAPSIKWMQR